MAPKEPPGREKIIELLGRSSEEARHAEDYHAAAAAHRTPEGQAAHRAARDAAAMQLIELAGCAEGFVRNRGDPGTTLSRLDDALRPVYQMRDAHTHPETGIPAVTITPRVLREVIFDLRTAIGNLDDYTLKIQPPDQGQALNRISVGIIRIERDGFPDPAGLRPRDLHYAEHYRSIQFGRLAKAIRGCMRTRSRHSSALQVQAPVQERSPMTFSIYQASMLRAGSARTRHAGAIEPKLEFKSRPNRTDSTDQSAKRNPR